MNKQDALELINIAKQNSKERKFKQSYDLIVSLKGLNLKKPDQQVDFFIALHNDIGKKLKICGLVGPELADESEKIFDHTIKATEFEKYQKDKTAAKKLASEYNFFVAQANIMAKVAATFGRIFGPRGKMPNPKIGCVVPPKASLGPLQERLQKTVRANAKTGLMFQVPVGKEGMEDKIIVDNMITAFDQIVHHLPNEKNNIKDVYLKTTMGKPAKLGHKEEDVQEKVKEKKPKKDSKEETKKEEKVEKEAKADTKKVEEKAEKETKVETKEEVVQDKADEKSE